MAGGYVAHEGEGTAVLVADRGAGDFLCYWYAGPNDGHLVERGRAATAVDAIAWGRQRARNVRIRTANGQTWWAGQGPRPDGIARAWPDVTR